MKNWILNVFRRDFLIFVGGLKVFIKLAASIYADNLA